MHDSLQKGYAQREGTEFGEVFAPMAKLDLVHLIVTIAAKLEWKVHHLYIKFTFINGELAEEVYVA